MGFEACFEQSREQSVPQCLSHWSWPCQPLSASSPWLEKKIGPEGRGHQVKEALLPPPKKTFQQLGNVDKLILLGHLKELFNEFFNLSAQANLELLP